MHRRPGEWPFSGEHLVRHNAQRIDVAPRRDGALSHATHVAIGPDCQAGPCHPRVTRLGDRQRDPKIRDDRGSIVEENVLGLDVPVDDTVPVRVVERAGYFGCDSQRVGDRKLLLSLE